MSDNRRSKTVTQGVQRSPNRALLRAVGLGDGDFDKPIVGVANAHSTITPCNIGIGALAARAEGDSVTLDAEQRLLQLNVPDDEIARRRAIRQPPAPRYTHGVLAKYARVVSSASKGAVTD